MAGKANKAHWAIIDRYVREFPNMGDSDLARYIKSEEIAFADTSVDALRFKLTRARDRQFNVTLVTIKLPTGDIPGKLISNYVIPL
jgi:hypothetical protein